jgi:exonuclease SbcC
MDNMHPYLTMPSRAMAAGPGGFAYYDHVCLPESEKDLVWAHEGVRYRSQVVIRAGTRRRTEAFLFARSDDAWRPVQLPDGCVSLCRAWRLLPGPARAGCRTAPPGTGSTAAA